MGGTQSKKPDSKQAQLKAKQDAVAALEESEQNLPGPNSTVKTKELDFNATG